MKIKLMLLFSFVMPLLSAQQLQDPKNWKHISTEQGDLDIPNSGKEQTSSLIVDVDNDGVNEFIITERTEAPGVVMYKLESDRWERYVVDAEKVRTEAGSAKADIDGDGDTDIIFGGEASSNQIWWWENPYPVYDKNKSWTRRTIKADGRNKHHDQLVGDFDGDGKSELVFWNQGDNQLCLADFPKNPKELKTWDYKAIYRYHDNSQMEQRGQQNYPGWKGVNEHEGLAKADIDGDGIEDIVGGGLWFKYNGNGGYTANTIDAGYTFSRSAAGDLVEGGRPEVVLVVGDGIAPMVLYEWENGTWISKVLVEEVDNGHSLDIIDFNGDGHLDIFNAEMRFGEGNSDAPMRILLGDGKGNFTDYIITTGFGNHESRIADLDGDGDYDILGKPYSWEAPRIDIWIYEKH
jgi:hypothetical protein